MSLNSKYAPLFSGNAPARSQDSLEYKMSFYVKSLTLDDDTCQCHSTLSMGHAMCFSSSFAFNEAVFGVDLLFHEEGCAPNDHVPKPTNGLYIYFKGKPYN